MAVVEPPAPAAPRRHLRIGVRELVAFVLRSGDLDAGFWGADRSLEGIRAHQRIQADRPPEYSAEVGVSHEVRLTDYGLTLGGRIDGVFRYADRTVIEEIKSTTQPPERLAADQPAAHWAQAECYAYIWAHEHRLDAITVQLTYYHLESGAVSQFRRELSYAQAAAAFETLVGRYLRWTDRLAAWGRRRDASITALRFPFAAFRPGQRDVAVAVYHTVRAGEQLLVQAATGIGKTLATLFPAVKALGDGACDKIFFLAARTTGKAMAEKALATLRGAGLRIKVLTITAKERICFNPSYACAPDECEYARGHFDRVGAALEQALDRETLDRAAVVELARRFTVCPFAFALDAALWCDVIVCDYNYAFDPRVYLRRFFDDAPGTHVFLVDEAHNLVDRSRDMFSATVDKAAVLALRRAVRQAVPGVHRALGRVNTRLLDLRRQCRQAGSELALDACPEALLTALRAFLRGAERWLARNQRTPFRDGLLTFYFEATAFVRVAEAFDRTYATVMRENPDGFRVKLFCRDPSVLLAQALTRCRAAVFFSATLTPPDYFRRLFGCRPDARHLRVPSPFPPHRLCLLVADRVSTYYHQRGRSLAALTDLLEALVGHRPGNYLFFFPSYAYLAMAREAFAARCPQVAVVSQATEMSETDREAFLERFGETPEGPLAGFAVMGGVFGEGIDLVGERLSGAAVVGVGLPARDLERELIRDHFQRTLDAGFAFAYQYPGFNRVLQAAGRVIRSATDKGVVLLVDTRFNLLRYRRLFPPEWQPRRLPDARHLNRVLAAFWDTAALDHGK